MTTIAAYSDWSGISLFRIWGQYVGTGRVYQSNPDATAGIIPNSASNPIPQPETSDFTSICVCPAFNGGVFVFGKNDTGFFIARRNPNPDYWKSPVQFVYFDQFKANQVIAGMESDGGAQVLVVGDDGLIHRFYETSPGGEEFDGWWTLVGGGMQLKQVALAPPQLGQQLHLFSLGTDGKPYMMMHLPQFGAWTDTWLAVDTAETFKQIAVTRKADSAPALFGLTEKGGVKFKEKYTAAQVISRINWRSGGNASSLPPWKPWGDWVDLGGVDVRQIRAATNADGRLEVFGVGGDGNVYHRAQIAGSVDWTEWNSLQRLSPEEEESKITEIEVSSFSGRLFIFATGDYGWVSFASQTYPADTSYNPWVDLL